MRTLMGTQVNSHRLAPSSLKRQLDSNFHMQMEVTTWRVGWLLAVLKFFDFTLHHSVGSQATSSEP